MRTEEQLFGVSSSDLSVVVVERGRFAEKLKKKCAECHIIIEYVSEMILKPVVDSVYSIKLLMEAFAHFVLHAISSHIP